MKLLTLTLALLLAGCAVTPTKSDIMESACRDAWVEYTTHASAINQCATSPSCVLTVEDIRIHEVNKDNVITFCGFNAPKATGLK